MTAADQTPTIRWSYAIDRTASVPEKLTVVETEQGGSFVLTDVVVPPPPGKTLPSRYPLETNLITLLDTHQFGIEQRVAVDRRGDEMTIRCAAGESPAGVMLSSRNYLFPTAMRGRLVIEGQSPTGFHFAMTRMGEDAPAENMSIEGQSELASIPASNWSAGPLEKQLVVVCPPSAAEAVITAIRIEPKGSEGVAGAGTWIWNLRPWLDHPERLLAAARRYRIDEIFLQFPIADALVVAPEKLDRLVQTLSRGGVAVHAVEGDPDMASADGRVNALNRARALRLFRKTNQSLLSVEYDIEPYLRPRYRSDPKRTWREWARTINELQDALGAKVSVIVPFWMRGEPGAEDALRTIKDSITAITVMAYRTDQGQIERFAQDWLDWGAEHGFAIRIAIENGPIATEIHQTYIRAPRGELVLDRSMPAPIVRSMSAPVTESLTETTYSFLHDVRVESSRISFLGNRQALQVARSTLDRRLTGWPSFGGLMIHELIDPGEQGKANAEAE